MSLRALAPTLLLSILVQLSTASLPWAAETEAQAEPDPLSISGKVTDPDGAPVTGARVWILHFREPVGSWDATTGEEGRFRIEGIEGTKFLVRVLADGFAPSNLKNVTPGADLEIDIEHGERYTIRVSDGLSGEPVPDAWVRAYEEWSHHLGPEGSMIARVDEHGMAEFLHLPGGQVKMYAVSPRHARHEWTVKEIQEAPDDGPSKEVRLHPGGTVAGRIVDASGQGVGLAQLLMIPQSFEAAGMTPNEKGIWQTAAGDGRFLYEGLPAGTGYLFSVEATGFASRFVDVRRIEAGTRIENLEVRLTEGATVTLKLLDGDGNPVTEIENARIVPEGLQSSDPRRWDGGWLRSDRIEQGDAGAHTFRYITPGQYTFRCVPKGFQEIRKENLTLEDGKVRDLGEIIARKGRGLRGTVNSSDESPLAEATVYLSWRGPDGYHSRRSQTGEDGRYEIAGLPDIETVDVSVQAKDHGKVEKEDFPIEEGILNFILRKNGGVRGEVAAEDGGEVTEFLVSVWRHPSKDDPAAGLVGVGRPDEKQTFPWKYGRFELASVEPGTYLVKVSARGYAPVKKDRIEVGEEGVTDIGEVILEPGLVLSGTVLKAADGSPVSEAGVSARTPSIVDWMSDPEPGNVSTSDEMGRFRLDSLEAGSYNLRVEHVSFSSHERMVTVRAGEETPEITVEMTAGGAVEGTVRDAARMPVEGARILIAKNLYGKDSRHATTDAGGEFSFPRLDPGNWVVQRWPEESADMTKIRIKNVTVQEGEVTVVDFDEEASIRLSGRLLRGEETVPGANMGFVLKENLLSGRPDVQMATADGEGRYSVGLDAPGTYMVTVIGEDVRKGLIGSVELEVREEPEVVLDVVLPALCISGRVISGEDEPVGGAKVNAMKEVAGGGRQGTFTNATTEPTGRYEICGLSPGSYVVSVEAEGYVSGRRGGVAVGEGSSISGIDLRLEKGVVLHGRVVDPGGRGVSGVFVVILSSGPHGEEVRAPATTDSDGSFRMSVTAGEMMDLVALAGGWAPALKRGVAADLEGGSPVVIRLGQGGSIRARVVDGEGRPLAGIQVLVEGDWSRSMSQVTMFLRPPEPTDHAGITTITQLVEGMYTLRIGVRPEASPVRVSVRDGEETVVDLPVP